jgi:hypothetical protein
MPENIFFRYLSNFGTSMETVERLTNIFKISFQAAAIRTSEISPEPCIAMLWKIRQYSKSKALHLIWNTGPGRSYLRKEYYLSPNIQVTYPSTIHKAYEDNILVKSHKIFKTNLGNKRFSLESRGFGYKENKYVISIAFPNK